MKYFMKLSECDKQFKVFNNCCFLGHEKAIYNIVLGIYHGKYFVKTSNNYVT